MRSTEFQSDAPLRVGTHLIEASAGTGKTYTITSIVVRLIVEERLTIQEILIVTFTEAATAELRDRVRQRLREAERAFAGRPSDDELLVQLAEAKNDAERAEARGRVAAALISFDEALISTIHGFCRRVLQEHAFESGTPFDAELVTDTDPMLREAVADYWTSQLYEKPASFVMRATEKQAFSRLLTIAGYAVADPDLPILPEATPTESEARAAWDEVVTRIRALYRETGDDAIATLLGDAPTFLKGYDAPLTGDRWKQFTSWIEGDASFLDFAPSLRYLTSSEMLKEARKNRVPHAAALPLFSACDELQTIVDDQAVAFVRGIGSYARDAIGRRKEEDLVQGFDDLLVKLRDALSGPRGGTLVASIRAKIRAAMIDEFQDTDPIQYEIFQRAFDVREDVPNESPPRWLFLIGDPKQAIYSFRGADIFTYLRAADDARANASTLSVNWRSDDRLIAGIEQLFIQQPTPFVNDRIVFNPPTAHYKTRLHFPAPGDPPAPLTIRFAAPSQVPQFASVRLKGAKPARIRAGWFNHQIPALLASEVIDFLECGASIERGLESRPVGPGDIAILVRKNAQARRIQREFFERGIPSVLHGDSSVFESVEAEELIWVLRCVVEPSNARLVRAALTTDLIGVGGNDLYAMEHQDVAIWETWIDRLREWNSIWHHRGFIQMFRQLLDQCDVTQRMLTRIGGERRMTNHTHLAELLQRASREERLGPAGLLRWIEQVRASDREYTSLESKQIRLENDAASVQLVTIHKSKGLQYPIVYAPYLWDGQTLFQSERSNPRYHDASDGHRRKLDVGSDELEAHVELARQEAAAENLRLLYVAVTRACHRLTLYHGAISDSHNSPLAWLLHHTSSAGNDGATLKERLEPIDQKAEAELLRDVQHLAANAPDAIAVTSLPTPHRRRYSPQDDATPSLAARTAMRKVDPYWRSSSFTQLTSHAPVGSPAAVGRDLVDPGREVTSTPSANPTRTLLEFQKGARAGTLLHNVLEHASFDPSARDAMTAIITDQLQQNGLATEWVEPLRDGLSATLDKVLESDTEEITLATIPTSQQLRELGFVLPVADQGGDDALTSRLLADLLRDETTAAVPSNYADQVAQLGFEPLRGYLRGFIDLVFATKQEGEPRFYVVDYKSNYLGPRVTDYDLSSMTESMAEHHYFLQYHLYVVALHRYLRQRLPNYDPARHLGGVFYLYLRGMIDVDVDATQSDDAAQLGIFFDRPSPRLIDQLDALLAGSTGAAR